jgi:hypothetical protein
MTAPRLRLLAALALGLCAGAARADHLDDQLNKHGQQIVEALQKQGVKNVGVLRFRVKQGDRPESFDVGPLNGNMATRLENVLVMHAGMDEKTALGVIHDAGHVAAQHKVGKWHDSEAEQRKLFAIDNYPLAWGDKKVKADAFLTGVVKVSADCKHGTVIVEEIKSPSKTEKLAEIAFDGDAALLIDLGKSYSLSKRSLGKATSAVKTRELVFAAVNKRDDAGGGDPGPDQPAVSKDTIEVGGVEFQMIAGRDAVSIRPRDGGGYQLDSPDVGKEITFKISNKTDKTLGVDVKLNGTSLFLEQADEPANCRVFLLKNDDKHRSYSLKGYFTRENDGDKPKLSPFKVLVGDDAQKWRESAGQLGDKVGTIAVTVFAEGEQSGSEVMVSARGMRKNLDRAARSSLAALQHNLMKSGRLRRDVQKRELIVADNEAIQELQDTVFKSEEFKRNPVPVGSATINVMPKSAASAGGN